LYFARLSKSDYYSDDPDKLGWVRVLFGQDIRWARPVFQFGSFSIPSREWIEKYGTLVGVYVDRMQDFNGKETSDLVWVGFSFFKPTDMNQSTYSSLLEEALNHYSYVRILHFTEDWKIWTDNHPSGQTFRIQHTDGTFLQIRRSESDSHFEYSDGVVGHSIRFDGDGGKITDAINDNVVTLSDSGIEIKSKFDTILRLLSSGVEMIGTPNLPAIWGVHTSFNHPFDIMTAIPLRGSSTEKASA